MYDKIKEEEEKKFKLIWNIFKMILSLIFSIISFSFGALLIILISLLLKGNNFKKTIEIISYTILGFFKGNLRLYDVFCIFFG